MVEDLACHTCEVIFEGRPNRKYCCPGCRRAAEFAERRNKRADRNRAFTIEEKDPWDDLPTWEEMIEPSFK